MANLQWWHHHPLWVNGHITFDPRCCCPSSSSCLYCFDCYTATTSHIKVTYDCPACYVPVCGDEFDIPKNPDPGYPDGTCVYEGDGTIFHIDVGRTWWHARIYCHNNEWHLFLYYESERIDSSFVYGDMVIALRCVDGKLQSETDFSFPLTNSLIGVPMGNALVTIS